MGGAADEFSTRKMGPRAITFLGNAAGILFNCPQQLAVVDKPFVLGEDGTPASLAPLVHGTYILRVIVFPSATFQVAVQQLNANDVATASPFLNGHILAPGDTFEFMVDDSLIDGIVAVRQCGSSPEEACDGIEIPIVTVNRLVTTLPMSATGDTASVSALRPPAAPAGKCGLIKAP